MKTKIVLQILLFVFFYTENNICAQVVYKNPFKNLEVENQAFFIEDKKNVLTIDEVIKDSGFTRITEKVHNFGITTSSIWFKVPIKNETQVDNIIFQINQPIIDDIEFYIYNSSLKKYEVVWGGEDKPFNSRKYQTPQYLFDINIPKDSVRTYYFKVRCKENMQIPMAIGTSVSVVNSTVMNSLPSGVYMGIMIAMILYNLFIFSIFRDKSYLLYSAYIAIMLLTQTSVQGYTFQLLYPNSPWMAMYGPFLFPIAVGLVGLEFFKSFLQLKARNNFLYKLSYLFFLPYAISIILCFLRYYRFSYMLMEATASLVAVFMLMGAYSMYKRGYSEARFFLFGWCIFLIGICIYALKDYGVLPYNTFTRYTMHFGSAVEVILLSFALADRINILQKEKESFQAEALRISEENHQLVAQQNVMLEQKVHERTEELENANDNLETTLKYLKDTQSQLVDNEKMASLGLLTAGIAHEINNPINFVSANIKPLKMDIQDLLEVMNKYEELSANEDIKGKLKEIEELKKQIDLDYTKKEIDILLNSVEDGAKRTAEIVAGLKTFSRLEEGGMKTVNINEGIESTLVLLRGTVPHNVSIEKALEPLPPVDCYPGKLNQVFMNIISNAIYAVNKKGEGWVRISSYHKLNHVYVVFEDSGIGMSAETKEKIFEPFYTTKPIGEGTGLGMSIVFKIIETHGAKLQIESELGVGTKITLILNKTLARK